MITREKEEIVAIKRDKIEFEDLSSVPNRISENGFLSNFERIKSIGTRRINSGKHKLLRQVEIRTCKLSWPLKLSPDINCPKLLLRKSEK